MDKKRLLELAGIEPSKKQLNEFHRFEADPEDMEGPTMGQEGTSEVRLRSAMQKAARDAKREGTSKEEFDHRILSLLDDIWSQMQTVRKRGERVGSTPRF